MKKLLFSVILVSCSLLTIAQSTPRMVLLEHFTQASCGPCATYNPAVMNFLNTTSSSMTSVKYQTWWPGFDPMYLHNTSEVSDRVGLYSVNAVPSSVIDGGTAHNGPPITSAGGWNATTITNREAVLSSFMIDVNHWFSSGLDTVYVSMKVKASDVVSASIAAHIVVVEKQISFTSSPGSNGETKFYNVMKKMLPNSSGSSLPSSWAVNDSVVITQSWALANVYDISQLGVVAFVQNINTDDVMQAAESMTAFTPPPGILKADISVASAHATASNLCDTNFIPKLTVRNNSSSNTIDTFQVSYVLNGGTPVTTDVYTTTLAPGANYTHTFDTVGLSAGENTISYYTNTLQDLTTYDLKLVNNLTTDEIVYVIADQVFSQLHTEGFQSNSLGDGAPPNAILLNPDNAVAYVVDNSVSGSVNWSLGGFENSSKSYRWRLYSFAGDEASIVWEKLDFSTYSDHRLIFSHAYAQLSSSDNDRLKVEVSIDCGTSWNAVYSKSGNSLITRSPLNNLTFYPKASEWISDTVSLSLFDGYPEVMLKFSGISDGGNCLYVDDINIDTVMAIIIDTTSSIESSLVRDIKLFPNPAQNDATMHMTLYKSSLVTINVYNILGENVQVGTPSTLSSGEHNLRINTASLEGGIYIVNITIGEETVIKRLTVIK